MFRFFRVLYLKVQTCQPLVKENLETHEQKSGDSAKNSEILLFFPNQTLPFENGGQTRRETISYWTQTKITAQYKK